MSVDVGDRRRLATAVLGEDAVPTADALPTRVARGVVLDITPHMLRIATPRGEEPFLFERSTRIWRGGDVDFAQLRPGDDVVIRCAHGGRWVAERVWAQIARVTGVITARDGDALEVDEGHGRPRRTVVIPYRSSGRIGVRHPVLEPGYLFDAIGQWHDGTVHALIPATTQAPHPVDEAPRRPRVYRFPGAVSGTIGWYDPALGRSTHVNPLARAAGAAYPALDPAADCGVECDRGESCGPLPLLSLGTTFTLRNDCTGGSAAIPVLSCGSAAGRFCDRCTACESDASGRIAQLTLMSFVALGGSPESGCFNATLTVG
ncbi:hypothetical protein HNR23_004675 [Nocardiopsis mwathae]|uniref:Uncharacterized protein n=1 Tax=Nocardiopsis mwathae TaxID=1472723 RepID=A0A7W9YMB7_9ACTN|nr:hypothetical protein [Nocardiopsis mwathae]MBB6174615.1 hypothetical protein [Nocardiopsis mwathae]